MIPSETRIAIVIPIVAMSRLQSSPFSTDNKMLIVQYHPKLPMSMRLDKKDCHTLIECSEIDNDIPSFEFELEYLETLDTSPSACWWIVPGTIEED